MERAKDLEEYGAYLPLENTEFKLHPWACTSGGITTSDTEGVISSALKEIGQKIAEKALRGQITEMVGIPAPAYVHHHTSHLNLQQNDMTQCHFLLKAFAESDPLERLKLVMAYYISGQYVSATITQVKVPLNPNLGETLQREMPSGEKLYCE